MMDFSHNFVGFLCLITLTTTTCSFVLEGNLKLAGYNFAFLGSFCGNTSGALVQYNFAYPQEYCCYKFFSYFQDQWRKIWPRPELDCHVKESVLEGHESQILNLTTNSSRAGCRVTASENGSNISCQGALMYQVQTEDYLTKKCWFLALSNCNATTQGIQMDYSLNITGATPNMAPKHHHGNLPSLLLNFLIITCYLFSL